MLKNLSYILISMLLCTSCAETDKKSQETNETKKGNPIIIFKTNRGEIEIELWPEVAPKACESMLGLIKEGYYNGIIFHRVIKSFMIQAGDPTGTGRGGESLWGYPFEDEVTTDVTFNRQGLLAMANAGPNTNGSQFFITTTATPFLNMKHTIFGVVTSGYDVVQAIENTQTTQADKPIQDQVIIEAYIK